MLTLWNLFEATLLCLNAVCVLHEERFMQKMGWGAHSANQGYEDQSSIKFQILNLVRSIRTVTRNRLYNPSYYIMASSHQIQGSFEMRLFNDNTPLYDENILNRLQEFRLRTPRLHSFGA